MYFRQYDNDERQIPERYAGNAFREEVREEPPPREEAPCRETEKACPAPCPCEEHSRHDPPCHTENRLGGLLGKLLDGRSGDDLLLIGLLLLLLIGNQDEKNQTGDTDLLFWLALLLIVGL